MDWEIYPEDLYDIIVRLRKEYTQLPIYVAENGAAFNDVLSEEKQINDVERIDYIKGHLMKIADLNQQGADIRGYYLWSLMEILNGHMVTQRDLGLYMLILKPRKES